VVRCSLARISGALVGHIVELSTPVFALAQAPEQFIQANHGKIPMTPSLQAAVEQWVRTHTSDAILTSLGQVSLSAQSLAAVMDRLRQTFPDLFPR